MFLRFLSLALIIAFSCATQQAVKMTHASTEERTWWKVCWAGQWPVYPSDSPPHKPKCDDWEYLEWPNKTIRVLPILESHDSMRDVLYRAIQQWNEWAGRKVFVYTQVLDEADIAVVRKPGTGRLRGMFQLGRFDGTLFGMVIIYEAVDGLYYRTMLHELGHALGFGHDPPNTGYLMDGGGTSSDHLSPTDKKALRDRYGLPAKSELGNLDL